MKMESEIENIINGDQPTAIASLKKFTENAAQIFAFPELVQAGKRKKLWNALYNLATSTNDPEVLTNCFSATRILSREKQSLSELITEQWLDLIKKHSGLNGANINFDENTKMVAVEVEKCLCNLVFNSLVVATMCCQNQVLDNLVQRIKTCKENKVPEEIRYFDVKLLFLLTALCSEIRVKVRDDMNGIVALLEVLDAILKDAAEECLPQTVCLNEQRVDMACEVFKALFNITLSSYGVSDDQDEECTRLVTILRIYLLIPTESQEKTDMLQSNIINLLTNMPWKSYKHLITPVEQAQSVPKKFQFEGQNMTAFLEILRFLQGRFSGEITVSKQQEILSPVISVLLKGASTERAIRKYLRMQILPPLKDVHHRPEEGTTLRNQLCRLLTTPITQLRDLVAEFLFVLCKNSVNRMIKYTGYGNAAGLFAQRGLLGGRTDEGEAQFSSDDEDSETEEYAEFKHGINPVTGCYEAPHPNPMENMSEEQKEYEAMKLVELMDNLTKSGVIKPCRVGADGKPEPIEHVLQLQEGLRSQQINNNDGTDSD